MRILGPAIGLALIAATALAQTYSFDWHVIVGGGGASSGEVYAVNALIGEPFTGSMSGGDYTMVGGFVGLLGVPANLVVNGGFENIAGTFVPDGNQVMSLASGSTNIPGWTVVNSELLWGNNTNVFGPRTPYGVFSVDLTGYHDSLPYAGVSQVITTTPGRSYRLTFSLGADQDVFAYRGSVSVGVTAGSVSNVFTLTPTVGATGNVWMTFTLDFTATTNATLLTFIGAAATGGAYLGLDNVSVVPLLPPPGELRITAAERLGNDLRLSFTSVAGKSYVIQSQTNLELTAWTTVPGSTNFGTGDTLQTTLTNAFLAPLQFYRVWQLP